MKVYYWHLEYDSDLDNSHKYYNIYVAPNGASPALVVTSYGRKGFAAQSKAAEVRYAHDHAQKQVESKRRKGYQEVVHGVTEISTSPDQLTAQELETACAALIQHELNLDKPLSSLEQLGVEARRLLAALSSNQDLALVLERWAPLDESWKNAQVEYELVKGHIEQARVQIEKRLLS